MSAKIQIDPAVVERHVMELAQYGAHGETGVWRTVYSPEWVAAQDRVAAWCEEAGLQVRRDAVGNVWGRLEMSEGSRARGPAPARTPEARPDDIEALVELHTGQGPILGREGLPVGIVDSFPAFRHYLVEVVGRSDHAGAMPMDLRRDPMPGAA